MLAGHIVVDYTKGNVGTAKFYVKDEADGSTVLKHEIPMGNCTVADGFGTDGHCPAGDYYLGAPQKLDPLLAASVPFGSWFTPLIDVHGLWSKPPVPDGEVRTGIGAHGGGSASPMPFAPVQSASLADIVTDGCHRMFNRDNDTIFVPFVQYIQAQNSAPDSIVFSVVR
jgi:hypothetical protein